jgi:hypothetical protein
MARPKKKRKSKRKSKRQVKAMQPLKIGKIKKNVDAWLDSHEYRLQEVERETGLRK